MPTAEENKRLIERYPFLRPIDRWTGKPIENYNYGYTVLDSMPDGWRNTFGMQMCEELREELLRIDQLEQYRIVQLRVKQGMLCWYEAGSSKHTLRGIILKYTELSKRTCIRCGNPATQLSLRWISPYCDSCAQRIGTLERFADLYVEQAKQYSEV